MKRVKKAFTDGEVLGTSFKQRVLCGLCGFASAKRRSGGFLSCSFLDGRLVIETGASVISHGVDRRQCVAPRRSNARCTKVHTSPAKWMVQSMTWAEDDQPAISAKTTSADHAHHPSTKSFVSSKTKHWKHQVPLANADKQVNAYH